MSKMSALVKSGYLACRCRVFLPRRTVFTSSVLSGYWNKDWKPGPYPQTHEERVAAAKKYGLRPEDYEPYPDDGTGFGDYPKLPMVSADAKDPFENWDIPELRRNYGEPVHAHADLLTEDRLTSTPPFIPYWKMLLITGSVLTVVSFIYVSTLKYRLIMPLMPKQYPFNELYLEHGGDPANEPTIKHYTFERR